LGEKAVRGNGICRRKDTSGWYLSWVDAQGVRYRRKARSGRYAGAKAELEAERLRVEQAKILGHTAPSADTFKRLAERYLDFQKRRLSPKGYTRQRHVVNKHLRPFFTIKACEIRRGDVQRYVTERSGKVSPGTVQKELNILKHVLRLAVEWEVISTNPAQGVKAPRAPAGRVRYLQQGELKLVLENCPEWLRPIVLLAATTGMRRSEILGLRGLDVDLLNLRILLPQTKNGEGRIIYMNKGAVRAIQSVLPSGKGKTTGRIFRDVTPEQVSITFLRACRKSGVSDFHFHDLRHTAASWLRMAGADIHTVAQLLGHKDLRMAIRYQHLSPTFLAEAVGRLDEIYGFESPVEVPAAKLLSAASA
jgi:integrase